MLNERFYLPVVKR